jgi:nucleotide-binding universal stress UspA family protein
LILLGYDGSPDAQAAIDHAGKLFGGQPATVLTVWERFIDLMARTGAGLALGAGIDVDTQSIDAASEEAARERAEEGAARAKRAGLDAEPRTRDKAGTIADTILH